MVARTRRCRHSSSAPKWRWRASVHAVLSYRKRVCCLDDPGGCVEGHPVELACCSKDCLKASRTRARISSLAPARTRAAAPVLAENSVAGSTSPPSTRSWSTGSQTASTKPEPSRTARKRISSARENGPGSCAGVGGSGPTTVAAAAIGTVHHELSSLSRKHTSTHRPPGRSARRRFRKRLYWIAEEHDSSA